MVQKISFLNLKGGVGKTTIAVNVAANLSQYHDLDVLLVDLDPQTNSTVSLTSQENYVKLKKARKTLKSMYDAQLKDEENFDFDQVVLKKAGGVSRLDLLPSDLELIDIDIKISHLPNSHSIVRDTLEDTFEDYDFVVFDCPPNLGLLTQNGIFSSDYYVVPAQPDFLSTFGLDLVRGRVEWFINRIKKSARKFELKYGGLIFSRVRHTAEHEAKMLELRSRKQYQPIFETIILERTAISEAAAMSVPVCLSKTGFGWKDVDKMFRDLTKEFLSYFPKE